MEEWFVLCMKLENFLFIEICVIKKIRYIKLRVEEIVSVICSGIRGKISMFRVR